MAALTQKSEMELIRPLLRLDIFHGAEIRKLLATYPFLNLSEKEEVICALFEYLWEGMGKQIFSRFRKLDGFMRASGKRGNFIHSFEVFLLGINLLFVLYLRNGNLLKQIGVESFDDLVKIWGVIAGAHDIGRPLVIQYSISEEISQAYEQLGIRSADAEGDEGMAMKAFKDEMDKAGHRIIRTKDGKETNINALLESSLTAVLGLREDETKNLIDRFISYNNHGFLSAFLLCNKISTGLDRIHFDQPSLQHIIGSIAVHALNKIQDSGTNYTLKYSNSPLAYLLYLCDNIQDWSRPVIGEEEWPKYLLSKVIINENSFQLIYVLHMQYWDSEFELKIEEDTQKRKQQLATLRSPPITFGVDVRVQYQKDKHVLGDICIKL